MGFYMVLYGLNGFLWNKPGLIWFLNAGHSLGYAIINFTAGQHSGLRQWDLGTRPMGVPWKSGDGWTGWMDRLDRYGFVLKEGIPLESPNGQFT